MAPNSFNADVEQPLLAQNGESEVSPASSVGIVVVTSAEDAALARAEKARSGVALLTSRSDRNAEREKRGNADHSVAGLMLYALSTLFMSAMMILVKQLGKWGISVFIVLLIRSSTVLACALFELARNGQNPWGNRRKLLTLRGFLGFGGNGGYFWTVTLLPLNDAIVLTFLAPMWVAVLSPLLLRERPGRFTFVAIPLCLLGVCLIARPGVSSSTHLRLAGIVVGVFQAFFSGTAKMCVRELRSTEVPNVVVFYLAFVSTLGALAGTIIQGIVWGGLQPPVRAKEVLTCIMVGMLGYGAQISLTHGLRSAKAAPAIATSYLSVVWGLLAGYFLFHEVPTTWSVLGAAIIISCTLLLALIEKKPAVAAAPVAGVPETETLLENQQ